MSTQRPVFLDIAKMRFPITAVISILHRISGVILFLFIPLAIYLLGQSLASPQAFQGLKLWVSHPGIAFLIWVMLSATSFHLFAGIRHLLMDCGLFEHFRQAQLSAVVVLGAMLVCVILLGVWLW